MNSSEQNHQTKHPREEMILKGTYWLPGPTRRGGLPPVIQEESVEKGELEKQQDHEEIEEKQEETDIVRPAGGGLKNLKLAMVDSSWKSSPLAQITYYGGHWPGDRMERHGTCLYVCLHICLPVCSYSCSVIVSTVRLSPAAATDGQTHGLPGSTFYTGRTNSNYIFSFSV